MSLANLPSPAFLSKLWMINRQNSHIVTGMDFDSPLSAKLLISSITFFIAETENTSKRWMMQEVHEKLLDKFLKL